MRNARKYTCKILEMMDDGVLDPKMVAEMCLNYMSEYDVEDMYHHNDLPDDEEEEE